MRHWLPLATLLLLSLSVWGQHMDSVYTKDGVALPRTAARKNIRPIYRNHFYHPDTVPCAAAPVLWVVAPPQFAQTLRPFLQWKQQSGYRIDTFFVTMAHCDSIHSLLRCRYVEACAQRCAPDYVLIVGDATLIPPFLGRRRPASELTSYYTDLYYGEYTGDFYPEAVVGRLPASNDEQLQTMLDKTLAYEQMSLPEAYLRRAVFVAGKENLNPAPTVTNGQVNYLSQAVKTLHPEMDTVCFRNPGSEHRLNEIVGQIRQGAGLICYTAHGTIHGWHYPDYTYSVADTLSDTTPAIYVNNCCYSNSFVTDCFGVHLMCKALGGAVGVIGAANSTLWEEDYLWSVGARQEYTLTPQLNRSHPGALDRYLRRRQLSLPQQAWTLGDLMHAGNYAVSEAGSIFEAYYWEIYNLLGDPTLIPLVGSTAPLAVAVSALVLRGATEVPLTGTPNSYVAVSDSSGLLGSGWIDSNGTARVALKHGIATETIVLTAVCAGHTPCVTTVHTVEPSQSRLAVLHQERQGDSLTIVLGNVSSDTCFGHTVELLQLGDDSCGTRIMTTAPAVIDTVAPQGRCMVRLPLIVGTTGQQPMILLHIVLADNDGVYSQQRVSLPHTFGRPHITDVWPLHQGMPARRITFGTPYTLAVAVANPTDDTTYVAVGVQQSFSTYAIAPEQSDTLSVDIVPQTPGTLPHNSYCLSFEMQCGAWRHDTVCCLSVDGDWEDFETGDLTAYPWDNTSSMQPWIIDSDIHYSGSYSLRSGSIGNRQTSDVAITVYLPYSDTLTFYRRTSTEENYDHLQFYVDNVQYDGWSGQAGWSRVRYVLPQGRHRLLWRYRKDESGSHGDDCVWIDNIRLPLAVWDGAYGYGGAFIGIQPVDGQRIQPHLYPNPANNAVMLQGLPLSGEWSATLYDLCGRKLCRMKEGVNNIDSLAAGVYLIVVRTPNHSHTLKLIVQ